MAKKRELAGKVVDIVPSGEGPEVLHMGADIPVLNRIEYDGRVPSRFAFEDCEFHLQASAREDRDGG